MSFTVSKNGRLALLNVATQVSGDMVPYLNTVCVEALD